jgi:hypothetical protein
MPTAPAKRLLNLIARYDGILETFPSERKIRGVLHDMQNDCIVSNIRAIAILSSIVTGPFWRLINDNSTTHFDLHQYGVPLQQALWNTGNFPQ